MLSTMKLLAVVAIPSTDERVRFFKTKELRKKLERWLSRMIRLESLVSSAINNSLNFTYHSHLITMLVFLNNFHPLPVPFLFLFVDIEQSLLRVFCPPLLGTEESADRESRPVGWTWRDFDPWLCTSVNYCETWYQHSSRRFSQKIGCICESTVRGYPTVNTRSGFGEPRQTG